MVSDIKMWYFSIDSCKTNLTSTICSPFWTFCKQSDAVTLKVGTVNWGHLRNENYCEKDMQKIERT
jgi:hypothetical protein